jgi:3' terminal RNA ribose 2'-O-methyltransferase Hen1
MLLTLTCTAPNADELGYLLLKNPSNVFEANLSFGKLVVCWPECSPERSTVALLLDVDPVGLVRNNRPGQTLEQYVNDRPYVASSLISVALVEAFSTAMNGRSRERTERVAEKMPLEAHLDVLHVANAEDLVPRLFEPLGYTVELERLPLDPRFPQWGDSSVYRLTLRGEQTVQDLLTHLYVLMPVLDNSKHYFVGADEVEKLLKKGERWLPTHPEYSLIARRYLNYRHARVREAIERIEALQEDTVIDQDEKDQAAEVQEEAAEAPLRLHDERLQTALEQVRTLDPPAQRALDLGCGEGRLLKMLLEERMLTEIVGIDVSSFALERAARHLHLDNLPPRQRDRIRVQQGSVVYRDDRFAGFDVALLIEVIEHLDLPRLTAMEGVVFGHARPRRVVITTPNSEYNRKWPSLPAGKYRHNDHRFEWTRSEFHAWSARVAEERGYRVTWQGIGPEDTELGAPTQMAVFDRTTL